jgi:phosphoglycolate phosphatase
MKEGRIKGIMFDLDGTLLDTIGDIASAMNGLRVEYGLSEMSEREYASLVGYGALQLVKDCFSENNDRAALLEEYRQALRDNSEDRTNLYEGISQMLDRLSESTLPLAILTNKPHKTAEKVCFRYLSSWSFSHIRGQVDGIPSKPHPFMAKEILGDWCIAARECLYLGDTEVDMTLAQNAGFLGVGCTWGFRSREELEVAGADVIVDHPREVLDLLELDVNLFGNKG